MKRFQKYYVENFIKTFFRERYRRGWLNILSEPIDSWDKLSSWDFWDSEVVNTEFCKEWSGQIKDLRKREHIARNLDRICVLLRIGHDQACISELMLSEVVNHEVYILEGVVIIEPEMLAIAINHDGGVCLCEKQ